MSDSALHELFDDHSADPQFPGEESESASAMPPPPDRPSGIRGDGDAAATAFAGCRAGWPARPAVTRCSRSCSSPVRRSGCWSC